jgi:hypothetical protein
VPGEGWVGKCKPRGLQRDKLAKSGAEVDRYQSAQLFKKYIYGEISCVEAHLRSRSSERSEASQFSAIVRLSRREGGQRSSYWGMR